MNNWKVWTAFMLVFLLGAACGVLGSGIFVEQRIVKFKNLKGTGLGGGKQFLHKIETQVKPDEESMKEIRRIVAVNRQQIRGVRGKAAEEILQIFIRLDLRFYLLLTSEQQVRFANIMDGIRKRFERIKLLRSLQK